MYEYVRVFLTLFLVVLLKNAAALEATIIIPKDPQITSKGGFFGVYHVPGQTTGPRSSTQRLMISRKTESVEVHRRVDNGTAGSGVIYWLDFSEEDQPTKTILKFSSNAQKSKQYQEGLFGKFDVPVFTEEDAINTVLSGVISYQLEVDSAYPVDSIKSNFKRLADGVLLVGTSKVTFQYDVFPYRNGSKAVVKAVMHAPQAGSDGVVDFKKLIDSFFEEIKKIVAN